jgi:hypothetical protein
MMLFVYTNSKRSSEAFRDLNGKTPKRRKTGPLHPRDVYKEQETLIDTRPASPIQIPPYLSM